SNISLIFSPMTVVPGSRKLTTSTPNELIQSASIFICVLFPQPSGPSRTINLPFNLFSKIPCPLLLIFIFYCRLHTGMFISQIIRFYGSGCYDQDQQADKINYRFWNYL